MTQAEDVLRAKSHQTGIPFAALLSVYSRGIGAWKTNPESVRLKESGRKTGTASRAGKMGPQQWAMARVNAFIAKRPTVYTGADDDIRRKYHLP